MGCTTEEPGPARVPLAALEPTPPPRPQVTQVAGTVEVRTEDASWNDQLGLAEDGPPAEGSVDAATSAIAAGLDAWLDSAQRDDADLAPLKAIWVRQSDPEAAAVLESGITNRDNPVREASYKLTVLLEPDPSLVTAVVSVLRHDGTTARVQMIFDVTTGEPRLDLVGGLEVAG